MIRVQVLPDPRSAAMNAAKVVAEIARARVGATGRFTLALSGGHTPLAMFGELARLDVQWEQVAIFQVDERVAPAGDPDRNLTHQLPGLPSGARMHSMPVEDRDIEAAADRYAAELPPAFDLVHLGLGTDGHTASLVPGDPVLDIVDRDVAITGPYQGRRRMTLTFPPIDRARTVLWLVAGADKSDALQRLRAGDEQIPAARVKAVDQRLICDRAATTGP
jgi:6-phosphogluconolactonase